MMKKLLALSCLSLVMTCSPAATDEADAGGHRFGRLQNRQIRQINRNNRQLQRLVQRQQVHAFSQPLVVQNVVAHPVQAFSSFSSYSSVPLVSNVVPLVSSNVQSLNSGCQQVQQLQNQVIDPPPFVIDPPPFQIQGNVQSLNNGCFGY